MEKYFKTDKGKRVNVIEHCAEVLAANPNAEILIATDSQDVGKKKKGKRSVYSTVIVYRYGIRGAHFIYNKTDEPKIKDTFTRLFKECELSLELAEFLTHNSAFRVSAIELDYNDFKNTKSTPLISATKGWCESLGYRTILKSGEMIASKAADHVCRHSEIYK